MARDGNNFGLLSSGDVLAQKHSSNPFCGLVTIHEGHVTIHEYERILIVISFINGLLNDFNSLLSIVSKLRAFLSLIESQNHKEALNDITIELLIINDQNLTNIHCRSFLCHECIIKLGRVMPILLLLRR
jgi:hypothetical protein